MLLSTHFEYLVVLWEVFMSVNPDPLIGQYIGHYLIKALISQELDSALYQAIDARTSNVVLIRKFFPESLNAEQIEQFTQYARKLIALTHPNIEKVLDFGLDSGYPYLVTQYSRDDKLQKRIETPMTWQEIVKIFLPLTHALFTAHASGIYHQDLRPANILLPDGGNTVLSNFGIPHLLPGTGQQADPELDSVRYLSPEQAQGNPADARSNIYATGCILYRLSTGRLPFDAESAAEVMQKHLSGSAIPPREVNPEVPEELQNLILRAMAKSPDDRFPDMASLGVALQRLNTVEKSAQLQGAGVFPPIQSEPGELQATGAAISNRKKPIKKKPSAARVILIILVALIAVVVVGSLLLSIGGAFLLSRSIQNTFKDTEFTFYNVDVERTETMTEKEARIALNKSLEFDNDLLSDFSVDFQSPDIALLGAKTPAGKVFLQVQVSEVDGKPQFSIQKLNQIPLLFVGSILSNGINDGLTAAFDDADFSINDLEITSSRISYSISPK